MQLKIWLTRRNAYTCAFVRAIHDDCAEEVGLRWALTVDGREILWVDRGDCTHEQQVQRQIPGYYWPGQPVDTRQFAEEVARVELDATRTPCTERIPISDSPKIA